MKELVVPDACWLLTWDCLCGQPLKQSWPLEIPPPCHACIHNIMQSLPLLSLALQKASWHHYVGERFQVLKLPYTARCGKQLVGGLKPGTYLSAKLQIIAHESSRTSLSALTAQKGPNMHCRKSSAQHPAQTARTRWTQRYSSLFYCTSQSSHHHHHHTLINKGEALHTRNYARHH